MARVTWAELDHPGFVAAYGGGIAGIWTPPKTVV
jgi:hypothetical protein